jgi:hypothetical protein
MDGVLSDAASRQHFIERGSRDWHAFFEACGEDPLIEEVARLIDLLQPELRIVLSPVARCGCSRRRWRGSTATPCVGTC